MHLLGPLLLLLVPGYLALSDSQHWKIERPTTLYAWEGSCAWIPCRYSIPAYGEVLENLVVYYKDFKFDSNTKDFTGPTLYEMKRSRTPDYQTRVQFLGDNKFNCTLRIHPVEAEDSGQLGLRMTSKTKKWMEKIDFNVSKTPPPPRIQLPPDIQELQEVTLTCWLNISCSAYRMKWQWSLEESQPHELRSVSSTSLTTTAVSTQNQLTFRPQWTHHGKNLTCQLWDDTSNMLLSQQMVQLDVKYSPLLKIKVSSGETIIIEGDSLTTTSLGEAIVKKEDSVTMMCQIISSNPEFHHIVWVKDGDYLIEKTLKREQTLTLTLSSVTKQMSGKYHCEAQNRIGSRVLEVALQVHYAPEPPRVQISSSSAKEESTVELTCISQANPPPTNYTWYHNRIEVPRETSKTFQISKVLLRHAGNYSCSAENSLGRGKTGQEAELDVQYSPKEVTIVIQNPTPIREGDNVTLSCNYTSSHPSVTRYEWNLQGSWKDLLPGVRMIQKVAWNAWNVTCAACNLWCSWAPHVNLHVQYAPRDVKVLLSSPRSEIHSGHPVLLQCNFSSSRPTDVRFFWKKNGILLKEGRELSFDSITPEDAGNYNCLVNNSIGQSSSEPRMLQVLYAPRRLRVSISPKDSVQEGKKVVLRCESDANPPILQYTWFDWNNQNFHHDDQILTLGPVTVQHSGAYWCQGTNRLGMGRSPPSTLTVYYSLETISRRVALGVGLCLAILLLVFLGVKLQPSWKRIQSQQGIQENSSEQSFFVRNKKMRRAPFSERPHSLGCYNPVMEDTISYATLRFPMGDTDMPRTGDTQTPEAQRPSLNRDNTVTYAVVQKRQVGDYENVTPNIPEDEGIHYSELVHLGLRERPLSHEGVEYVTLKH
ncbi:B-cell receptor CD22 isoform X1 [Saccopteryx bilineata]|uniref:B-cell receptor CD22 isoform X1 n=1 Tax=Saccopteryx bilineata TaxID=59482 RepID=UPI00338DDEBA